MSWFSRLFPKKALPEIEVVGADKTPLSDAYHLLLRMPWWLDFVVLGGTFVVLNVLFAVGYFFVGGVSGPRPGRVVDLFFFSVETMGTIGYGEMFPTSTAAHSMVTVESFIGIVLVALTTGLVFSKFSIPRARMQFAERVSVAPFDGVPTLMIRLGNQRASQILEAIVRVVLMRTERTREGVKIYRMYDLRLLRERSPALTRSWTVMHRIEGDSPLVGATPESLARDEVEIALTVVGMDETSAQNLHARHRYTDDKLRWGERYADLLSDRPDGGLRLDMRRFHDMEPSLPIEGFPYPVKR